MRLLRHGIWLYLIIWAPKPPFFTNLFFQPFFYWPTTFIVGKKNLSILLLNILVTLKFVKGQYFYWIIFFQHILYESIYSYFVLFPQDVSYNKLSNSSARALGKLLNNRSLLQHLNLIDNGIGPQGAAAIAHALGKNTTLKTLNLRLNR